MLECFIFAKTIRKRACMKKIPFIIFLLIFSSFNATAQVEKANYRSPLNIPLLLSANFGELRPNHFHSGIDLKTEGVINKPVFAIEDGYVSRIFVSPSGYGLALYVNHPRTGQMSLYGHLERFGPAIANYVKERQNKLERFNVDLYPDKSLFPIKKGDLIAYSGNSGSSGGPHVHFEIRDLKSGITLDPLIHYKPEIRDTLSPALKGIAVYGIDRQGVVNGKTAAYHSIQRSKNGDYMAIPATTVWGRIGIGVYSNDRMNATSNIYGVKIVRLYCDGEMIFQSDIKDVNFATTRMINSLIDFDYWSKKKVFYMKSFVEPGNRLPIYKAKNGGYVDVNEEREYTLKYELEDLYGNQTEYTFKVLGKRQEIEEQQVCAQYMVWHEDNYYINDSFSLIIPKNNLYKDICFTLQHDTSAIYSADIYKVNDSYVPLHGYCDMKIKLAKDSLENKSHYGIIRIDGQKISWVGGTYKNGTVVARIRELGHTYTVGSDSKVPVITPLNPTKWVANKSIKIKLTDDLSGIASFRGTIDGKFALFEHDTKSAVYTYTFDSTRFPQTGKTRKLRFTAKDACGNTTSYEYDFLY